MIKEKQVEWMRMCGEREKKTNISVLNERKKNAHKYTHTKNTHWTTKHLFGVSSFELCAVKQIDKNASRNANITQPYHVIVYVQAWTIEFDNLFASLSLSLLLNRLVFGHNCQHQKFTASGITNAKIYGIVHLSKQTLCAIRKKQTNIGNGNHRKCVHLIFFLLLFFAFDIIKSR